MYRTQYFYFSMWCVGMTSVCNMDIWVYKDNGAHLHMVYPLPLILVEFGPTKWLGYSLSPC